MSLGIKPEGPPVSVCANTGCASVRIKIAAIIVEMLIILCMGLLIRK
jgi:hypothetical protein